MKLVTFSKPLPPHSVGDTRLVPDDVAESLRRGDMISASVPWPSRDAKMPERPMLKPSRLAAPAGRRIAE